MHKINAVLLLSVLTACAANRPNLLSCTACNVARKAQQAVIENPNNNAALDAYIATLMETPEGSGFYALEGDLRMSREQIRAELAKSPDTPKSTSPGELIINLVGGMFDYWKNPSERHITYVFDASTFPGKTEILFTRTHLAAAAKDWMDACPKCGITFKDIGDVAPTNNPEVTFHVVYAAAAGGVIAQSFFPSDNKLDRVLYVYPSYFGATGFDPTGVLRHELGHVLGYRHEHIVGIPGCATEGTDWKMLTPYTPNSVMHYFCGGAGSYDLSLREQDKRGHQCLYLTGKPCPN